MDCSLKKQSICTKENLLNGDYEISLENEFTMPDYYAPVKRIVNCKSEPAITSKAMTGKILNIDGVTGVKVIYLDNDEQLCCFESAFVFNKNIELDFENDKVKINTKISDYKLDIELKGERKFLIKGSIEIKVNIIKLSDINCICGEKEESFEMLKRKCNLQESVLMSEKNIILDDEIELSDSHATVSKIINCYGKILPDECKIMNGKIMLKGALAVHITYMSEDSFTANQYEQKIPYSQVCDVEGIDDRFCCKTEETLVFLEVKSRNSGYDESRAMTVNAKICVDIEAELCSEKDVVLDIFSTKNELSLQYSSIENLLPLEKIKDSFSVRKSLEFSEGTFGSIIDMWSTVKIGGVKCSSNIVTAFGVVCIKFIARTEDNSFEFFEKTVDFEYRYNAEVELNDVMCEIKVDTSNLSYIITSNSNLDIICDLNLILEIFKKDYIKIITDAEAIGECSTNGLCEVNICYVENQTDLWSIAKKYKSKISDLIEVNSLDKEQNTVSGMLLIPVK